MVKNMKKNKIIVKFPHDSTKYIGRPIFVFPDKSVGEASDVTDVTAPRLPCPNVSLLCDSDDGFLWSMHQGFLAQIHFLDKK